MSLSKEILEGTREKVEHFLAQGAPINVIDEYGYTPLIHATVLKKAELVKLLLTHHADPNLTDITGSTALHWAVDNNDFEIAQILIQAGADVNAYTAHGQPVLFYPYLRKNKALTELLLNKGANLNFAKDFINAKLVGHRFELQGSSDIVTPSNLFISIDLEGFYLEFTLDLIHESLDRFIHSFAGHRIERHDSELKKIMLTLEHAIKLREFKHFNVDHTKYTSTIHSLLDVKPLLLPVSYKGHAITFIRYDNLFAACDRGVHQMTDPIKIYSLKHPKQLIGAFFTSVKSTIPIPTAAI